MLSIVVSKIGDESPKGNVTLTMYRTVTLDGPTGESTNWEWYRQIVKGDTLKLAVDDSVDFNMDIYDIDRRKHTFADDHHKYAGQTMDFDWVIPRRIL